MAKPERKRALRGRAGRMKGGRGSGRASTGQVRLWGHHAVEAALMNPARRRHKLWATREAIAELDGELPQDFVVEYAAPSDLDRLVSRDAPHQGLVLDCAPLVHCRPTSAPSSHAVITDALDAAPGPRPRTTRL